MKPEHAAKEGILAERQGGDRGSNPDRKMVRQMDRAYRACLERAVTYRHKRTVMERDQDRPQVQGTAFSM